MLLLRSRLISLKVNWHTFYRARLLLPFLPLYQIRQGTRLHSRPTPRISYRDRLTFTSTDGVPIHFPNHAHERFFHTLSPTCTVLIISTANHSPWVVWSASGNSGQRHRAVGTGGGNTDNEQRQQAATTPATGSVNNGQGGSDDFGSGQGQQVVFCLK